MIPGVESFLEQYHMIEQSDVVVAGVSGGADSVCLLLHLLELKEKTFLYAGSSPCAAWHPGRRKPSGCSICRGTLQAVSGAAIPL